MFDIYILKIPGYACTKQKLFLTEETDKQRFFRNSQSGDSKNTEHDSLQSTTGEGLWRISLKMLLNLEENSLLLLSCQRAGSSTDESNSS